MITVYLILLTYLSVYLFLAQLHNYGFNITTINFANVLFFKYFDFCCYALNLKRMLLRESSGIETNPGLRKSFIKFCHWNLNGLAAHDFVKMPLIEAFITTHNFDIICLSETLLDSSIDISDTRVNINGYSLLRGDHPSNNKRGGVCMYYKNYLPVIRRTDLSGLQECIVAEVTVDKERCSLTCLCRSPSQNDDEFETFCSDLTFLLNNINKFQPSCSVLLGHFNAKHSKWCSANRSNKPGIALENITSTAGCNQTINKPTHFTNVSSSCIDLIFASNTTYLNTGIEQSVYDKCRHSTIYGKLNFDIPLPAPYYRKLWDYKKANTEAIQRAISAFNWDMAFQNKDINNKTKILNGTLLNIFNNFIPNKISKFDHEKPVWMNKEITSLLKKRSKLIKKYYNDPTDQSKILMVSTANECTRFIVAAKEKNLIRLSAKLEDPSIAPKTYWFILHRFLSNKKLPIIAPILVDDRVVSNFAKKSELFNSYFASQCSPVTNKSSYLP